MKKQYAALAATAVLATSLAACSSGNTIQPPAPAASPAASSATSTAPAQSYTAAFGGSVTFPSGVKVSISRPKAVPAPSYAYGAVGGKIVVVVETVTNGSKVPVKAGMMGSPKVTYGADGVKAEFANDVEAGIGTAFLSTILPGETQTVKEGYGVPASGFSNIRVEVDGPDFTDQPAVFKGSVG